MPFLCIVSSNADLIIISAESCTVCVERKLNLEILKKIEITMPNTKEFLSLGVRAYNVKCQC